MYSDKDWPITEKDHAAVITYLDAYVGELVEQVKSQGHCPHERKLMHGEPLATWHVVQIRLLHRISSRGIAWF